jgi:hypothetical protein
MDGTDGSFGLHRTYGTYGSGRTYCILSILLTHVMHGTLYSYNVYNYAVSVWLL